jgi:hypothetical protein
MVVSIGIEFDSRISLTINWQGNVKYVRHVCNGRVCVDWSRPAFEPRIQFIAWPNLRPRKPLASSDSSKINQIKNIVLVYSFQKPCRISVDSTSVGVAALDAFCCCCDVGGACLLTEPLSSVFCLSHYKIKKTKSIFSKNYFLHTFSSSQLSLVGVVGIDSGVAIPDCIGRCRLTAISAWPLPCNICSLRYFVIGYSISKPLGFNNMKIKVVSFFLNSIVDWEIM